MNMTVENTGFLVDRLGEDCEPLQWVRELTQNSIEAILKLPNGESGDIVWDVDSFTKQMLDKRKLCIMDTGIGMTGDEQRKYINRLSSSSGEQALDRNFGIGAKIAGVTKHPAGLLYFSWQENVGSFLHLWKDPGTGAYGAKQLGVEADENSYVRVVSDELKPSLISSHGTKVVLMGSEDDEDTMKPPFGVRAPTKWLRRYLNTRYFQFPSRVRIRVREGWDLEESNQNYTLREVKGQKWFLSEKSEQNGQVALTGAVAHWWILREGEDLTQNFSHHASSGHVAALYQDELYELLEGPSGAALLQRFGVVFGYERVVMYVQPSSVENRISSNTARTNLLLNSERLPWSEWAKEFRQNFPPEIECMMAEITKNATASSNYDAIKERLKRLKDLFRFSRYRPTAKGDFLVGNAVTGGEPKPQEPRKSTNTSKPGTVGGSVGDMYALFTQGTTPAEPIATFDIPRVVWVTKAGGTRMDGVLEDRAAKYIPEVHQIQANGDFRGFADMIERYSKMYAATPGSGPVVEQIVREWFEQALVEAVLGLLALKDSPQWNPDQVDKALGEEALTTAMMPRTFVDYYIRRALGTKLGKLPEKTDS